MKHRLTRSKKMEYYRKRYNLMDVQVNIPRIDDVAIFKKARVNKNVQNSSYDKRSLIFSEDNSIPFPQSPVENSSEFYTSNEHTSAPIPARMEESEENTDVEKTHDNYYEESFRKCHDLISASLRLPHTQNGELDEGLPVVRVDGQVVRVHVEIEEKILMARKSDRVLNNDETKPKVCLGKECNSISTFIERDEEDLIDRMYFHVLSTEIGAENEIYLSGVFVEGL